MNNPLPNKEVPQNSTQEEIKKKRKTHEKIYVRDESTGIVYELHPEKTLDTSFAIISILYLLFMLAFFFWQLFDVWIGQYSLVNWIGYDIGRLGSPSFRLVAFTFIGGGLGGIINGIRSIIGWHSERSGFGRRFVWKYIVAPWIGTALALFAFALIRSGIAIIGGDFKTDAADIRQTLSMFAIGVLSGYGSREVFIWLDAQVKRIFKVTSELKVPNLMHKTKAEVEEILKEANLKLGKVLEELTEDEKKVGKVMSQIPIPDTSIAAGGTVDITIAAKKTV
jgi:hypothetical protein